MKTYSAVAILGLGLGIACSNRPPQNLQRNWPGVTKHTHLQVEEVKAIVAALEYRKTDPGMFPEERPLTELDVEVVTAKVPGGNYWGVRFVPLPPAGQSELRPGDNRREVSYMASENDFKVVHV